MLRGKATLVDPLDELAEVNRRMQGQRPRRRARRYSRFVVLIFFVTALCAGWRYRDWVSREVARFRQSPGARRAASLLNSGEKKPEELFKIVSPAVVRVVAYDLAGEEERQGTGFFVSSDGLLVTNYHVIEGARSVRVFGGKNAELHVLGLAASNQAADIAVLKVNAQRCSFLEFPDDDAFPAVGTRVYAIGNPLGFTNTLSDGLVSGVREVPELAVIQTTAAISPGSSGGPLVLGDGRVVGVTTANIRGGQNLNLAVAVKHIRPLLQVRGAVRPFSEDRYQSAP